jgi:hypothetical protein
MGANDYLIGGANIWFDDGNGFLGLGNIPNFNITREVNELMHFTASTGERKLDKSIINEAKLGFNFNVDEFDADNINILVYGDGTTADVDAGGSVTDEVIVAPLLTNRSIFTAKPNISALVVGDDAIPTTTYVENTDYIIKNAVTGEIEILLGTITAGQDLYLDYTNGARTRQLINPGKDFVKTGKARFEFLASCGSPITWIVQNCAVKVEGDITLDSENFSTANVLIDVLVDETVDPANPYGIMKVG